MIEVQVKLISMFVQYRENLDNGRAWLAPGATVKTLAEKIGLPPKYVRLIFVNGQQQSLDRVLRKGVGCCLSRNR